MSFRQRLHGIWRKVIHLGVAALLKSVDIALNHFSYRRVTWLLVRLSPRPDPNRQDVRRAVLMSRLINSVARHPLINGSCLRRSLVTWWLLRWNGVPSMVQIGVNLTAGHAWLEHQGQVVNDQPDVVTKYPIKFADELTPEKAAQLL